MHPNLQTHTTKHPTLLFYCQHSLGIGHLTRSFALAAALREHFHVVFLNGGRLPPGLPVPSGLTMIDLPALGMDDGHTVISRDTTHDVGQAQAARRALIDAAVRDHRPAVLLVELFPFGRKKFAGEILPMIRAAKRQATPALVACSLRDILVDARRDQQQHDDRARWLADRYFDAVLVHADPSFARLEDSFHPRQAMRVPVHYTGYVVPKRDAAAPSKRGQHLLVSAGGGIVGATLFQAALAARALMRQPVPMRFIAGPFLPDAAWVNLTQKTHGMPGVECLRQVPDMVTEMRQARASLSQCGYNTALDIVVAGVPALVVPYEVPGENEQTDRAERMAALGAMQCMRTADINPSSLAARLDDLLAFEPRAAALDLQGADQSARLLRRLHQRDVHTAQPLAATTRRAA
jgi:predicted glycosyltransferase